MKGFIKNIKGLVVAAAAALTLLSPVMAVASGESYYWTDQAHKTITATGGAYATQTTFSGSGRDFSAAQALDCTDGSSKADASIAITGSGGDQVPAKLTTSCATKADTSISILADKAAAATAANKPGDTDSCTGGVLSWILCPIYSFILKSIQGIENQVIIPFLQLQPLPANPSSMTYQIWAQFRNLANVAFILAFLIMIFAHTLSLAIDNYSLKKMLPRLVLAAIFVQFSFMIVALGIDISNILGAGIQNLVLAPLHSHPTVVINNVVGGVGIAAGIAGLFAAVGSVLTGGILVILVSAFFAVIAVFFTLVLRQVLITLLLLISPLAFVAWILPGTEQYFRHWRRWLTRLLLMYPMIVLLFASGRLFGAAAVATNSSGVGASTLTSLISVVANIIPLFIIPFTFKFAGEALILTSSMLGTLNERAKAKTQGSGYHERLQKRVQERRTELAAGEKIKGFGAITGNRVAAQIGRGAFSPPSNANNVRAMVGFNKTANDWKKRLEEENFTYEGLTYLSLGESWYRSEHRDIRNKIQAAQAAGNLNEVAVQRAALERLNEGRDSGKVYFGNVSARAAATLKRADFEVLNNDDRLQVRAYTGFDTGSNVGKLVGEQLWGRAKEGVRKSNVHLTFTDLHGNLDVEGLKKYVAKKTQGDWTNYSKDAIEAMRDAGVLKYMAETSTGTRSTLINIMGTTGGPSIGAEQQEIIRQVLLNSNNPDPAGHPDPANL